MLNLIVGIAVLAGVGYAVYRMMNAKEMPPANPEPPKKEPAKCGCGRSETGFCVGLHKLTEEEWAKHPANAAAKIVEAVEAKVEAVVETVVAEAKAVETAVEAVVEKVKKARKPRKKKGE